MPPATPPMMPPTTAPTGPATDPFFAPSVMPLTTSSARAPTGAKRKSATAANLSRSVFMNARPFRQEILLPHDRNQTSHPAKNVFTLNHSTISWVGGIYSHGRHGAQPYRRGLAMDLAESRRKRDRSPRFLSRRSSNPKFSLRSNRRPRHWRDARPRSGFP